MSRSLGAFSFTTSPPIRSSPLGDVLEPGDHPQRGGLAAARRADEDHELAVLDRQVHVPHGLVAVGVALGDFVENDVGHLRLPPWLIP